MKLLFCHKAAISLLFLSSFCIATGYAAPMATEQALGPIGFTALSQATAADWVMYNSDATKLAVVKTKDFADYPTLGVSIAIYSLNAGLQPQEVIFEDSETDRFISDFHWVGGTLIYNVLNCDKEVGQSPLEKLRKIYDKGGWSSVTAHVKVKSWPANILSDKATKVLQSIPPGSFFSYGQTDSLFIVDGLNDKIGYWDFNKKKFNETLSIERSIRSVNVRQGNSKLIKVPLKKFAFRWWIGIGDVVPLFVTEDSKSIIVLVGDNSSWNAKAETGLPAVININIDNSKIRSLTPTSFDNAVDLSYSSDPQFFACGNPAPVAKRSQVVCQLSLGEAAEEIVYRFGFFGVGGGKVQEVLVTTKELSSSTEIS